MNVLDHIMKANKYVMALLISILFIAGFLFVLLKPAPTVELGDHLITCNPKAKINLKKKYELHLWDYDLPLGDDKHGYRDYLQKAIVVFQKQYPNIKVEMTLLDILNGPAQLTQAIHNDSAPDVYCSLFQIPEFNYKKQIPVGFFLRKDDLEAYNPNFLDLIRIDGIPCYFPRWTAPLVWIGNKTLLEKAGLSVAGIQSEGWGWDQIMAFAKNVPEEKYLFVGSLGYNGFFPQFAARDYEYAKTISSGLDILDTLIAKKSVPLDIEQNSLGRFLSGQSMLLAGVRPVIYPFIKIKLAELKCDWEPVILPAPYLRHNEGYYSENGVICVYRNKGSAGDDHIAAAVKLGQFLSDYAVITPWKEMMVLPASQKATDRWRKEFIPELGELNIFRDLQGMKFTNIEENLNFQEKVHPALQDFCNGEISKEKVKAEIMRE